MQNIPRNLIIDLIPAYLADDVSDESRKVIESYAKQDQEIAELIASHDAPFVLAPASVAPGDELEFETISRLKKTIRKKMVIVAMITLLILLLPLTTMNFSDEVNWDLTDFVVMGFMLFGAGLIYTVLSGFSSKAAYKTGVGLGILSGFLLVWINLAVGIIGSEGNVLNLLYGLVFITAAITVWRSKFQARAMATAMFITATLQLFIPILALTIAESDDVARTEVFVINSFIALLLIISGICFKKAR